LSEPRAMPANRRALQLSRFSPAALERPTSVSLCDRGQEDLMTRNSRIAGALALAALAVLVLGPASVAAQPSYSKLPASAVEQFRADPQSLLAAYPNGGRAMTTMARNLLLSDPTLLGPLLNVAKNANSAQAAAIGGGLAQAARILVAVNPQLAAQIQLAVAQSGVASAVDAFATASNAGTTTVTGAGVTPSSAASSPFAGPSSLSGGPSSTSDALSNSGETTPSTTTAGSSSPTASSNSTPSTGGSAFTTTGSSTASPSGGLTSAMKLSTSPSRSSI
jgi:hypothetical protein